MNVAELLDWLNEIPQEFRTSEVHLEISGFPHKCSTPLVTAKFYKSYPLKDAIPGRVYLVNK